MNWQKKLVKSLSVVMWKIRRVLKELIYLIKEIYRENESVDY